jgi:hypothetical protein
MTADTAPLLALARECGASIDTDLGMTVVAMFDDQLAALEQRIRQDERERAARICDEMERQQENDYGAANSGGAQACAAAIRSSGTSEGDANG